MSLALQDAGHHPVALDVSPGAIEVCARRGVRHTFLGTVDDLAARSPERFAAILPVGRTWPSSNPRSERARFSTSCADWVSPDVVVMGTCPDPYVTENPHHLAYHELNRRRGRLAGQVRMRVRFERLATDRFDYLFVSPTELSSLAAAARWEVETATEPDPGYLAVLRPR